MIVSRSNMCPHCGGPHQNSCYIVYSDGYKCFSCGASNIKSKEYFVYRPIELVTQKNLFIPEHTGNPGEFDGECLQWLYKYYMFDDDIRAACIAYCPAQAGKNKSLLLPILDSDNNIIEYQRRFFPKEFYSTSGVKQSVFECGADSDTLVLTEDYISAVRVGNTVKSMCLFGTSLNKLYTNHIVRNYSNIIVWLDDDEPGQTAAIKIIKSLTDTYKYAMLKTPMLYSNNITITSICNKQPKELSNAAINNTIIKHCTEHNIEHTAVISRCAAVSSQHDIQ